MSQYGFITISRSLFEHDFWTTNRVFSFAEAWIDLIQMARWDEGTVLVKSEWVQVERGQIVTAERFLATRWKWSRSKLRAFLDLLKKDQMIDHKKTTQKTTITLCNFDKYNTPKTAKKTTEEPQKNHKKTTKRPKKNNDNKYNNNTPPIPPPVGGGGADVEWRTDYQAYLDQLRRAYRQAKSDTTWIKQRETYHPNLDVLLSLEKACTDFWATEEGWKNKTRQSTTYINWKLTFNNALTQPQNRVFKPRDHQPISQQIDEL